MKCPCEECLIIPVCKNKQYNILTMTCHEVKTFLNMTQDDDPDEVALHKERVWELDEVLKSNVWCIGIESDSGYDLETPKRGSRP